YEDPPRGSTANSCTSPSRGRRPRKGNRRPPPQAATLCHTMVIGSRCGSRLYRAASEDGSWSGNFVAVDVGYLSAVGAGALSFLSPCVLPLVPPYLCYMAGVSMDDFRAQPEPGAGGGAAVAAVGPARMALFGAAFAFVLGFSTVF